MRSEQNPQTRLTNTLLSSTLIAIFAVAPLATNSIRTHPGKHLHQRASMPVTATVDKNSPTAKLGLSIKRSSVTGTTRIGRVSDEGLFASTSLKEGMKVISINDTRVAGMELGDILDVLKNAEGTVTIVADEDSVAEPAKPKPAVAPPSPVAPRPSVSKSLSNKASGLKEYVVPPVRGVFL